MLATRASILLMQAVAAVTRLQAVLAEACCNFDRCYEPELDFYPYLSTKTAYQRVRGNVSRPGPGCTPVQMWVLARHGTRYPGKEMIPTLLNLTNVRDEIIKNHERGDGRLCPDDLENLRDWQVDPSLKVEMADILAPQGKDDLYLLAKSLRSAFPELLSTESKIVHPGDYIFRATDTQRTMASLESFMNGLFNSSEYITPRSPPKNDTLLLPHKNCPLWESEYGNNEERLNAERDRFTARPEIQDLLESISKRLGFVRKINIDLVKTMYEMCRFEAAWYLNRTSTWCTIFRKEDLKIIEYREDLSYYYSYGPGREISGKLGCEMLTNMFNHFKNLEAGNFVNQPKGIFYFAHTLTLQYLMAALRIGKESAPILATTYASSGDRKYRTSLQGSFATNVIAVFYSCNETKLPNKVVFYVAEKLVQMPGCEDGLCDWEYLKQEFQPEIQPCNMDFCYKLSKNKASTNADSGAQDARVGFEYFSTLVIALLYTAYG